MCWRLFWANPGTIVGSWSEMSSANDRGWLHLDPRLDSQEPFVEFCRCIEREVKRTEGILSGQGLRNLRRDVALIKNHPYPLEQIRLHLANSVALDLVAQTWKLKVRGSE